ncbi:MAG: ribose 5-phosphate isomerase B [Propioniciclava sp.]
MRIAVGSDRAGTDLKAVVADHLRAAGHTIIDVGWDGCGEPDYSAGYARAVAHLVRDGDADRGILVCGTGVGISIAANKVRGIRAVVCSEPYTARHSREHNGSQIVAVGAYVVGPRLAITIVEAFLAAEFAGGRYRERFDRITAIEDEEARR